MPIDRAPDVMDCESTPHALHVVSPMNSRKASTLSTSSAARIHAGKSSYSESMRICARCTRVKLNPHAVAIASAYPDNSSAPPIERATL